MSEPDAPIVVPFAAVVATIDALPPAAAIDAMAEAFVRYSKGEVSVPPIQTLGQPPLAHFVGHKDAQACIKSAYINGGETFVTKVASGGGGFNSGIVLVFSQRTFRPKAILLDGGWLTELRTAAAGALAAQRFAPADLSSIGVIGCGIQARWQLRLLASATRCRSVRCWARRPEQAAALAADAELRSLGWRIEVAPSIRSACETAGLVLTVTCARSPLVRAEWLRGRDVLVTAVGADSPGKQELEPSIFGEASLVLADSRSQTIERGEMQHAVAAGILAPERVVEIGEWIGGGGGRPAGGARPAGLVVFDSTGVAVQDVAIAELALAALPASRL